MRKYTTLKEMENELLVLKTEREIHKTELEIQKEIFKSNFNGMRLYHSVIQMGKEKIVHFLLSKLFNH